MISAIERKNNSFYVAFGQLPPFVENEIIKLTTTDDIYDYLQSRIPRGNVGLLLSSGRDSLILATCLPKGTIAYTARLEGRRDESIGAGRLAAKLGLRHKIIEITREDYNINEIPMFQQQPLLCCPWTYKIATEAQRDGIDTLISGTGTLARFGEGAHYHDWGNDPETFFNKWAKHRPEDILVEPYPLVELCQEYIVDGKIDTLHFMSLGHGEITVLDATIQFVGLRHITPYAGIDINLDIERAKKEGKYILAELYYKLFGETPAPKRSPAVTNFREWLKDWKPSHSNFRDDINMEGMEIKRWQLYKLEQYWRLDDKRNWC